MTPLSDFYPKLEILEELETNWLSLTTSSSLAQKFMSSSDNTYTQAYMKTINYEIALFFLYYY